MDYLDLLPNVLPLEHGFHIEGRQPAFEGFPEQAIFHLFIPRPIRSNGPHHDGISGVFEPLEAPGFDSPGVCLRAKQGRKEDHRPDGVLAASHCMILWSCVLG
jgi:hypothetical protein